jgi:hypothetical protein
VVGGLSLRVEKRATQDKNAKEEAIHDQYVFAFKRPILLGSMELCFMEKKNPTSTDY